MRVPVTRASVSTIPGALHDQATRRNGLKLAIRLIRDFIVNGLGEVVSLRLVHEGTQGCDNRRN